jgi:two-component system chemotaxis response regulator CheY
LFVVAAAMRLTTFDERPRAIALFRDDPSGERAVGIRPAVRTSGRSMRITGKTDGNGHHPRVLVIDDDDELAEVLRQALRESGYAVATVRHGAAALDLVEQIQPDLILLDLRMPIMDGWSFVTQYRRSVRSGGRIVLVSGHPDGREISQRLGADAYVGKPFELTQLLSTVQQQLGAVG